MIVKRNDRAISEPVKQKGMATLAISLVFGLASSTALTLLVIPAIYIVFRDDGSDLPGE